MIASISARAWSGTSPTATGTTPALPTTHGTSTTARSSRNGRLLRLAVFEDQHAPLVERDRLDDGDRLALVAADVLPLALGAACPAGGVRLGEVVRLALAPRRAPGLERLVGRAAVRVVERGLLVEQELAARLEPRADRADRVGREVVEEEVLVRDHPERAQPLAAEQPALLERLEPLVVGEQAGQQVALAVVDAAQPAEVVEAEVVEPQLVGVAPERRRRRGGRGRPASRRCRRRGRRATSWIASVTRPAGFVKLTNQRLRRALGRPSRASSRITGTVRSAKQIPPGPGRLLADDALVERHLLVDDAALELADADRAEDEVGALERLVEAQSSARNGSRSPRSRSSPSSTGAIRVEPRLVDVVERRPPRARAARARASSAP